jgi:hypothetical protein
MVRRCLSGLWNKGLVPVVLLPPLVVVVVLEVVLVEIVPLVGTNTASGIGSDLMTWQFCMLVGVRISVLVAVEMVTVWAMVAVWFLQPIQEAPNQGTDRSKKWGRRKGVSKRRGRMMKMTMKMMMEIMMMMTMTMVGSLHRRMIARTMGAGMQS